MNGKRVGIMLGRPIHKKGEYVRFEIDGNRLEGEIYIVDEYGTFFQDDVSYDIRVGIGGAGVLYKHVPERKIIK